MFILLWLQKNQSASAMNDKISRVRIISPTKIVQFDETLQFSKTMHTWTNIYNKWYLPLLFSKMMHNGPTVCNILEKYSCNK